MRLFVGFLIVFSLSSALVYGWDSEELEIFDLVEEISKNFYGFMGISQNATNNEIKRAFRGLSIQLHPDKNPAEDANIQFRNLVSIYEVLKDSSKREKYDKVLRDGLPNWKSALYYYRRMRKIGLYEGAAIIFVITIIGQYLFAWAEYLEKKYTAEQVLGSKLKKLQKKNKNIDMEMILNEIPSPSLKNTLPIQIPVAIWNLLSNIKYCFNKAIEVTKREWEQFWQQVEDARQLVELKKEQAKLRKEKRKNLRKHKQNLIPPQKFEEELKGYFQIQSRKLTEDDSIRPVVQKASSVSGKFWTYEDLAELIRLVKKYPPGSENRWITIAENMNRTLQEVTFMAERIETHGFQVPGQMDSVAENIVLETQKNVKKDKTKKEQNILIPETNWSQEQQKALEDAIVKYSKTGNEKWQKIASCVPDKSKEECLIRYKYLCKLVKSQKKAEERERLKLSEKGKKKRKERTPLIFVDEDSDNPYTNEVNYTEAIEQNQIKPDEQQDPQHVLLEEPKPVTAEDVADKLSKKGREKRKNRKERTPLIFVDEDSDNPYTNEVNYTEAIEQNQIKPDKQQDPQLVLLEEPKPVTAEDVADKLSKKGRGKRKNRKERTPLIFVDEDSDNPYTNEVNYTEAIEQNQIKPDEQQDPQHVLLEEPKPVTAEDVADKLSKKGRGKRKSRKERTPLIFVDEDSDNPYTYEVN